MFNLLGLARRKLMLIETIPKLGHQRKTLWRRQAENFIAGEQSHALRVRPKYP